MKRTTIKSTMNKGNLGHALALAGIAMLMAATASADNNPNALWPPLTPVTSTPSQTASSDPNNGAGTRTTNGSPFQPIPQPGQTYPPNIPSPYGEPGTGWNGELQKTTGLDVNGWVAIGSLGLQILSANQPTVNVNTPSLSILPVSQPNWTQLAGWSMPIVKQVSFSYRGTSIVYNITWNADGSVNGQGRYIANLRANVVKMKIGWGYTYDVVTEAHDALNRGTVDNPIAAIGFDVKFRVHTFFGEEQVTQSFFISGDGQIAQMQ